MRNKYLFIGGLVKKILETKKDYESSPSTKSKEQVWHCFKVLVVPVNTTRWRCYSILHCPCFVGFFYNKIPVTWVNAFQNLFIKGISIFCALNNTSGMCLSLFLFPKPDPVHCQFTKESSFANGVEKCNCSPLEALKCYSVPPSLNN